MDTNDDARGQRDFIGYIWIGEQPVTRLAVTARSPDEARAKVEAKYGAGHVVSLWNEGDANAPR